jgi:predicted GNAT superfamily acetyltransferase
MEVITTLFSVLSSCQINSLIAFGKQAPFSSPSFAWWLECIWLEHGLLARC